MSAPIIIDCFAGGGGASTGIEMALGRSPDYAINHDPVAVAMHAVNHPASVHLCQNVYRVDPLDHFARAHIGFAWFSPDCKHFSKAKGGAPVQRNIRDLAWIIPGWIERIQKSGGKVDVVAIENVEEFQTWGPLLTTDKGLVPDPARRGETFKKWCAKLRQLGGRIEWRELRACDYGAPTIRKRVFILIRFDGRKIVWPEPTHGHPDSEAVKSGKLKPWLTAGCDVIDWSIVCPSIFDSKAEILLKHNLRAVRPLAGNTQARVARGIKRYVLDAARPFLVSIAHGDSGGRREYPVDEPYHTVTVGGVQHAVVAPSLAAYYGKGKGGEDRSADPQDPLKTVVTENRHAVVSPSLTRFNSGATGAGMDEPVPTVTANSFHKRPGGAAPLGVLAPVLAGCGGRAGQSRPRGGDEPMATVTAKADTCVVASHLMTMRNAGKPFQAANEPTHTVTAGGAGLTCVAASLAQTGYGEREGQQPRTLDPDAPLGTVVAGGVKHAPVAAYMAQHNGNGVVGRAADQPLATATQSGSQSQVVAAHVMRQFGASTGHGAGEPTGSVTSEVNKTALVAGALTKYYGTGDGQEPGDPLHTVIVKDRFCLSQSVLATPPFGPEHHERAREVAAFLRAHGFWDEREFVTLEIDGVVLVMVDIGMRMLTPRELFKAQGFPADYEIERDFEGNVFSKSDQVGRAGNSVCPPLAEVITRANVPHLSAWREAAE